MKKIFFIILAVIVVILVFSLGTFGVEAESVLSGYENTRRYAQDAKMLTVAVDTYKEEVEKKVADEEKLKETEPVGYSELSPYGTIDEHSVYEGYTDGLVISNDPKMYVSSTMRTDGNEDVYPTDENGRAAAARFDSTLHYLTSNDTACDGTMNTELRLYSSRQCAAFGAYYVNQVLYKEDIDVPNWKYLVGAANTDSASFLKGTNTCWKANTPINYLYNTEELKKFFTNVTPGTFVRSDPNHSYIILGADDERVILYDCNQDMKCGIKLHDWTWEELSSDHQVYVQGIHTVIAPPGTQLPYGCTRTFDQVGTIL